MNSFLRTPVFPYIASGLVQGARHPVVQWSSAIMLMPASLAWAATVPYLSGGLLFPTGDESLVVVVSLVLAGVYAVVAVGLGFAGWGPSGSTAYRITHNLGALARVGLFLYHALFGRIFSAVLRAGMEKMRRFLDSPGKLFGAVGIGLILILLFLLSASPFKAVPWANQFGSGVSMMLSPGGIFFMIILMFLLVIVGMGVVTLVVVAPHAWFFQCLFAAAPVIFLMQWSAHFGLPPLEPVDQMMRFVPAPYREAYEGAVPHDSLRYFLLDLSSYVVLGPEGLNTINPWIGGYTVIGLLPIGLIIGGIPKFAEILAQPTILEEIDEHWENTAKYAASRRENDARWVLYIRILTNLFVFGWPLIVSLPEGDEGFSGEDIALIVMLILLFLGFSWAACWREEKQSDEVSTARSEFQTFFTSGAAYAPGAPLPPRSLNAALRVLYGPVAVWLMRRACTRQGLVRPMGKNGRHGSPGQFTS